MAKRLPKPYRHEPNNGRYPNHLSILIMSDYTGIVTSTNSLERAEATIAKNNKRYPFGVPPFNPGFRVNAQILGQEAIVKKMELDARHNLHYELGCFRSVYHRRTDKLYYHTYGPYMINDPLHTHINR